MDTVSVSENPGAHPDTAPASAGTAPASAGRMPASARRVSIVIPAFNEEGSVDCCVEEIGLVMETAGCDAEFVIVDDGSSDGTWREIRDLARRDPRVTGLRHSHNYGKASALASGFAASAGDVIAICDADGQYAPEDVLRVIEKVYEGYDAVSANKIVRRDSLERRVPSKFFNFFLRTMTGVELHDMNAGLKAFCREAAEELIPYGYGELHRYFVVILGRSGYRLAEVPVRSRPRASGTSKYGAERYVRGALDFVTVSFLSGYLERPLHLFGGIGLTLAVPGTLVVFYQLIASSLAARPPSVGWLVFAALLVMGGLQFIAVGLFAEMVNRLQHDANPSARVRSVVGKRAVALQSPSAAGAATD